MVASNAPGQPRLHELLDPAHHTRAVRSTVHQVPHEHQGPLGDTGIRVTPQEGEETVQRLQLPVNVPDQIQGTFGQGLDELGHGLQVTPKAAGSSYRKPYSGPSPPSGGTHLMIW